MRCRLVLLSDKNSRLLGRSGMFESVSVSNVNVDVEIDLIVVRARFVIAMIYGCSRNKVGSS